jgi:FKBP-type peptidyl-prolyl cis-trans isomerase 2
METIKNDVDGKEVAHEQKAQTTKRATGLKNLNITPKIAVGVIILLAAVVVIYVAVNNSIAQVVRMGDTISVNYTGTLTNGTVFDASSLHGGPFNFTVGSNVIQGFSNGVIGMTVGETKTVTIPVNEAYGPINPALIMHVPTNVLKTDLNVTPAVGMHIRDGAGEQGVITAVNATNTTVDFNSPLAGQTLTFKITIVKILKTA